MPTITISSLIQDVRRKSDMENSQFVSDSEILNYLNGAWQKLYGLLVERFENYYVSSAPYTFNNTTDTYALPADFWKLLGIDLQVSSEYKFTMRPWSMNERNRVFEGFATTPSRYILQGDNVRILPKPDNSYTAMMWYVPVPATLTLLGSVTLPPFGDEYVTFGAAIDCKQKEESDVSVLMAQAAEAERHVLESCANRDVGLPQRMTDTSTMNDSSWLRWWQV